MNQRPGRELRNLLRQGRPLPFIGVYDVFSASIAARYFKGIFVSGFSFAASHYGLPDIGFIAWSDILGFVQRLRAVLPDNYLLVDLDDGYADVELARHVAAHLEHAGAAGIVLEDQRRPRKCGHLEGKRLLDLDEYLEKLDSVLAGRRDLMVVARTDASEPEEVFRRARSFADAGADAVLVDAVGNIEMVAELRRALDCPLAINQIGGGKTPLWNIEELEEAGASIVLYSTPCLFAAQRAVERTLDGLRAEQGLAKAQRDSATLAECHRLLRENLEWRHVSTESAVEAVQATAREERLPAQARYCADEVEE